MIKKLLSVCLLAATMATNAQQVLNPGFESWTSGNPDNWGSFTQMLAGLGITGAGLETQTTTKNSGTYAILLENKNIAAIGQIFPGLICTGPITYNLSSSQVVYGRQAYASQPQSYSFYIQYAPTGIDTGFS